MIEIDVKGEVLLESKLIHCPQAVKHCYIKNDSNKKMCLTTYIEELVVNMNLTTELVKNRCFLSNTSMTTN